MYYLLPTLFIAFASSLSLNAQTFVATYQADLKTITGGPRGGVNELYFTTDSAIYIHKEYPLESGYSTEGVVVNKIVGDANGAPILTLRQRGVQRFKEEYSAGKQLFIFEEPTPKIKWEIVNTPSSDTGQNLVKAICTYGGRAYEAWFNPDLPFPYGPHRFGGLPGLIIKIASTDGVVSYTLTSFRKLPNQEHTTNLFALGDGVPIDRKDFEALVIKKLLKTEARTTDELRYTSNDPPANYAIEKNHWNIISTYKEKRGY